MNDGKPQKDEFALFDLDANRLDEEWVNQPRLYLKYALRLADLRRDHEKAKAGRELVAAELDQSIRRDPTKYGLEKCTEASVERTVLLQDDYQRADASVRRAKYEMDVTQAMVETLDHRKKALENLVYLWGASYFAEPTAPKGVNREAAQETVKKHVRNMGKKKEGNV